MTELVPFNFNGNEVRVIVDLEGNPWWVASDVARILGYSSARAALRSHVRDHQKGVQSLHTLGGNQDMLIVNEGGLYRLIMRSDLPATEAFQDWVTDEVLPSLRRERTYSLVPQTFAEALELAAKQQREIEAQQSRIAELEPAAEQFHRWQFSGDTVYIVEWAKTLGLTQKYAYEALRECGVLFKQQHQGAGYMRTAFNVPKRGYEQYFVLVDEWLPGPRAWTKVLKITAEGQVVLAELLMEKGWVTP